MATLGRFLAQVRARTEIDDTQQAEAALRIVLATVVRRLTPDKATHLIAQLPSLLQPAPRRLAPDFDKSITRAAIEAELSKRLEVDAPRAAKVLAAIGMVWPRA